MAVSARHIFSLNQMQTKQKYGTIVLKSFKWKSNATIWYENSIKSQTCFVSTFYVYCIVKSIQVECCCFCFFVFAVMLAVFVKHKNNRNVVHPNPILPQNILHCVFNFPWTFLSSISYNELFSRCLNSLSQRQKKKLQLETDKKKEDLNINTTKD